MSVHIITTQDSQLQKRTTPNGIIHAWRSTNFLSMIEIFSFVKFCHRFSPNLVYW